MVVSRPDQTQLVRHSAVMRFSSQQNASQSRPCGGGPNTTQRIRDNCGGCLVLLLASHRFTSIVALPGVQPFSASGILQRNTRATLVVASDPERISRRWSVVSAESHLDYSRAHKSQSRFCGGDLCLIQLCLTAPAVVLFSTRWNSSETLWWLSRLVIVLPCQSAQEDCTALHSNRLLQPVNRCILATLGAVNLLETQSRWECGLSRYGLSEVASPRRVSQRWYC